VTVANTQQPPRGAIQPRPLREPRASDRPEPVGSWAAGVGVLDDDGVMEGVPEFDGVFDGVPEFDGVTEGVPDGDGDCVCVGDSVFVGVRVDDALAPADGVAEHESAAERPVDAHPPHGHGIGAADASGQ
jgi:hypothetical protein